MSTPITSFPRLFSTRRAAPTGGSTPLAASASTQVKPLAGNQTVGQDLQVLESKIVTWFKKLLKLLGLSGSSDPTPTPSIPATYTVKKGDTLSSIAKSVLGDANRWREIYDLNRDQLSNPDKISPGQVLKLPGGGSVGGPGSPWKPGPGQIQGSDTSHYQSDATFNTSIKGAAWSAIKASQGTGYTDPTFQARWKKLGELVDKGSMKLRMAYCYLDAGDGVAQAKHFLNVVGVKGPLPAGTRLVLDWEGSALKSPSTLTQAANYIRQVTGLWPVIYVQGSKSAIAQDLLPEAPIWEAAWGSEINRNVPFFQYSEGPGYDHDVFNGDMEALKKFAGWK